MQAIPAGINLGETPGFAGREDLTRLVGLFVVKFSSEAVALTGGA